MSYVYNPFTGTLDDVGTGGTTSPAGSSTWIQYNNAGAFGASSGLSWNNSSKDLLILGTVSIGQSGTDTLNMHAAGMTFTDITGPGSATAILLGASGVLSPGSYCYKITTTNAVTETNAVGSSNVIIINTPSLASQIMVSGLPLTYPNPMYKTNIYRTLVNGSVYYRAGYIQGVGNYTDNMSDATLAGKTQYNPYNNTSGRITKGPTIVLWYLQDPDTGNAVVDLFDNSKITKVSRGGIIDFGGGTSTDALFQIGQDNNNTYIRKSAAAISQITFDTNSRVGILNETPTSSLDIGGNIEIGSTDAIFIGDPATNNTYKLLISNDTLSIQRRIGGTFTELGRFEA